MSKEIYKGKISKKILIVPGIFFALFFIESLTFVRFSGSAAIAPLVIGTLIISPALIRYSYTSLIVLDDKVKGEIGFFRKERLDAPLDKINDVYTSQGMFGRMLNYGTINIATSSSNFSFKGIEDCELLSEKLLNEIENYKKEQAKENARLMAEAMKQNS